MMTDRVRIINALLWKDSKNIGFYLLFCIVITVWALLFIIGNGLISGNSSDNPDGLVAYTPFIITMFSAVVMITSLSEETKESTLESLLCTSLSLREILCSKILFVIVFPYVIFMLIMLPLLAVVGKPVVSLIVLYQMIVDLPLALLVVAVATTAWLVIPGKHHGILNLFCSACFIVSLIFYFNMGAPYGFSFNIPVSPIVTTILLGVSIVLLYPLYQKIGTIEKSDVI
jgi:ABC-2 type transport system permease protein